MSRESNAFEDYSSIKPLNKLGQLKDSNATARSIDTGFSQAVRLKRIKNDIERPIYMLESNNCYQSIERTRGSVVQKMIKWLSTLDWFSHSKLQEMIEIQIVDPYIYNLRCTIFPLKTRCLFAVYCTLLNDSYLGIYLQKTTTHIHTQTEKKKEGKKDLSRTRTQHLRLDATTRNHHTTEADYVTLGKSL